MYLITSPAGNAFYASLVAALIAAQTAVLAGHGVTISYVRGA